MDTPSIPLTLDDEPPTLWADWIRAGIVGVIVAALVFLGTIGWLTLQNTYATVHGHNGELTQLKTDESTVVSIGGYLEQTQRAICVGLNLPCPPPPRLKG